MAVSVVEIGEKESAVRMAGLTVGSIVLWLRLWLWDALVVVYRWMPRVLVLVPDINGGPCEGSGG